jgi:tRNA-(ms[2]io[6]A)-hydroxylase
MKHSLELSTPTPAKWIEAVLGDIPSFLQDHADCERKASAMALSFVAKYPDRTKIIAELLDTGIEELEHFRQVYQLMVKRGVPLAKEIPEDPYIKALMRICHSDVERRFLDRLLLASIIECRGAERFRIVANAIQDDLELSRFYHELWVSEAKHGNIFVEMALSYFDEGRVYERLTLLNQAEGEIVQQLEIRAALH